MTRSQDSAGETSRYEFDMLAERLISRRSVLSAGIMTLIFAKCKDMKAAANSTDENVGATPITAEDPSDLTLFKGPRNLSFSFLYPSKGWKVRRKPLQTHMYEVLALSTAPESSSQAGVTVDAVRIKKIEDFGTVEEVGQRVVVLEKKKDNVLSATVLSTTQIDQEGLTYYIVEYEVDTGRGQKHFVAKATVNAEHLFVFTAQAKAIDFDNSAGPLLAQMISSFKVNGRFS